MNDLVKRLRGRRVSASLRNDRSGTLEMREIQDPLAVEAADCIEELKRELAGERERADRNQEDALRLQWLQEHYGYVMGYPRGRGWNRGLEQIYDPEGKGDIRRAIDAARGK